MERAEHYGSAGWNYGVEVWWAHQDRESDGSGFGCHREFFLHKIHWEDDGQSTLLTITGNNNIDTDTDNDNAHTAKQSIMVLGPLISVKWTYDSDDELN